MLLAQGRNDDAIAALKIGRKYDKHDVGAALLLSVALTKAGKAEEAKSQLSDVIQPHDDPNHWTIQLVKYFQGEVTLDDALKAADAGPDDTRWMRSGWAHAYVGLLAYAQGDLKTARRYFETSPYLDRTWLEYSLIDMWRRAASGQG
jgi:tetratricopeptide (TPR) repeat protein